MSTKVEIEFKAKAGVVQFQDKSEIEVDNVIPFPDVEICAGGRMEIPLHAGPLNIIEFVIVKATPYMAPAGNGTCPIKPGEEPKTPSYWFNTNKDKPRKLSRTVFIGRDALAQAVGAGLTLDSLWIQNDVIVPIKVSAFIARRTVKNGDGQQQGNVKTFDQN